MPVGTRDELMGEYCETLQNILTQLTINIIFISLGSIANFILEILERCDATVQGIGQEKHLAMSRGTSGMEKTP